MIAAVVFDLDGVLVDSEQVWDEARRELTADSGGRWKDSATRDMLGMSSPEWSAYVNDELGVPLAPPEISAAVVARVQELYRRELPLLPGAADAVRRLSAAWPLGLASSSNRPVIDLVLELSGLAPCFAATVSSEEVARGKPAPDVYLEAVRRLDAEPGRCAAVEDSTNGIRSALAAGLHVVAVPMRAFPPDPAAVREAHAVVEGLDEIDVALVEALAPPSRPG